MSISKSRFCTLESVLGAGYRLIKTPKELHPDILAGHAINDPGYPVGDFFRSMSLGWQWFYSGAEKFQPKFFDLLVRKNPEIIALEGSFVDAFGDRKFTVDLFLLIQDVLVQLFPWEADNMLFESMEQHPHWNAVYSCLPEPIIQTYYRCSDGMCMTSDMSFSRVSSYGVPSMLLAPVRLENILGLERSTIKMIRTKLDPLIDHAAVEAAKDIYSDFRVVLDARKLNGDVLFFQYGSKAKRIFHLPNNDFSRLRIIENPVGLMDDYVSSVLNFDDTSINFNSYGKAL